MSEALFFLASALPQEEMKTWWGVSWEKLMEERAQRQKFRGGIVARDAVVGDADE